MHAMTDPILILGASARAAAFSALRAGLTPVVADLFADADLAAAGIAAQRLGDYPGGLARAAEQAPPGPWLYTGALENYPSLVSQIAQRRELLGNGPEVLAAVRDPLAVAAVLEEAGLPHPAVGAGDSAAGLPKDGTWLAKPLRGAAGAGIVPWCEDPEAGNEASGRLQAFYFQERIEGRPCSAVFVGHRSGALLLGMTEQLIGTPWCGGRPFGYCGSLGPLRLSELQRSAWERIGTCLVERFDLRGLFGVDAVASATGVWPVEVNPRYTASVELLERAAPVAISLQAIALQVSACRGEGLPPVADTEVDTPHIHGKAILFAPAEVTIDAEFTRHALAECDPAGWPLVADIPQPGTKISAGHPLCTVFARAESREAVLAALQSRQAELCDRLSLGAAG